MAAALAAPGLVLLLLLWWNAIGGIAAGKNDFAMLYAGARLAGKADLYHAPNIMRVKEEAAGELDPSRQYTRLPYLAALLWPLGRLPYLWAYWIFQAASMAALAAFLLLWPENRIVAFLVCCWSLPLALVFTQGQDVLFLVLSVTLALRWHATRPIVAGFFLALCAAKFHLFLHVPLVIAAQRKGRVGAGALLGGAGMAALSFAVAGLDWPARFLAAISKPSISPGEFIMPNLHGLLLGVPARGAWEVLLAAGCAALVWFVARRSGFDIGIAAALIAGLLTSVHAYPYDCALLIPVALILFRTGERWMQIAAGVVVHPVWYLSQFVPSPPARFLPVTLLFLLCAVAWMVMAQRSTCRKATGLHCGRSTE